MRRRGVLVSSWLAVTVLATLLAWAAVSRVTRNVAAPVALPPPALIDAAATETGPAEPAPADEGTAVADEAATLTEGYRMVGGTVTVRFRGDAAELVQASPRSGFAMEVESAGPAKVEVRFRSDDHESRLSVEWRDGGPDPRIEERAR